MVKQKIVIDNEAKLQLRSIYTYIKKDSVQNAERIRTGIIASIKSLINNPEQYPADKYRTGNDGSLRAFEIYNFRITYHISSERITVIRIRHSKRDSLEY